VYKGSNIIGFPNEVRQGIPADHKMMVKFQKADEPGYVRMKEAMVDIIDDWNAKRISDVSTRTPKADEVRQRRVQKFATYSGIVNGENMVQGDKEGNNVTMMLWSRPN
jgi:hypothetical protein